MGVARLSELKAGEQGTVCAVGGDDVVAQRLMELGLVEGATAQFVRSAPMGDPLEFLVNGRFRLSIRRADAALIEVERRAAR